MRSLIARVPLLFALLAFPATAFASAVAILETVDPSFNKFAGSPGRSSLEASRGTAGFSYVASTFADGGAGTLGGAIVVNSFAGDTGQRIQTFAQVSGFLVFNFTGPASVRADILGSFAENAFGGGFTAITLLNFGGTLSQVSFFNDCCAVGASVVGDEGGITSRLASNISGYAQSSTGVFAGIPFPVTVTLNVFGAPPPAGQLSALFDHTVRLSVITPNGGTYTTLDGFLQPLSTSVPEPSTIVLALSGLLIAGGLAGRRSAA